MLTIYVASTPDLGITGLQSQGHAAYADHGQDIVCAGVSALLQTALLSLEQHVGAHPSYVVEPGLLRLELATTDLPESVAHDCQVVLETALLGLRTIATQYPDHLRIEEFEGPLPNICPLDPDETSTHDTRRPPMSTTYDRYAEGSGCYSSCEFTPQKAAAIALLGAVGSVILYYAYCSLSDETREAICENVTATVKQNLARLTQA